jgi:nucleoside-diphosphate-sugar epimerase
MRAFVTGGAGFIGRALVRRLRSRMGSLRGIARVDGKVVVEGTMTFALGPRG